MMCKENFPRKFSRYRTHQTGAALFIVLIFLVILTMISLTTIQGSTLGERIANNEIDRNLAFQATEAALRDAERDLQRKQVSGADCGAFCRAEKPVIESIDYVPPAAGGCSSSGLCPMGEWTKPAAWNNAVKYGKYTNAPGLIGVDTQPSYLIEIAKRQKSATEGPIIAYRVTAKGSGALKSTNVTLQATYVLSVPK